MKRTIRYALAAGVLALLAAACDPIFFDGEVTASSPPGFDHLDMTSVDLAWTEAADADRGDTVVGYTIRANGSEVARTGPNQRACRLTSLDPGTNYDFEIIARSSDGSVSAPLTTSFRSASTPQNGASLGDAGEPVRYDAIDDRVAFRTGRPWNDTELTYFIIDRTSDMSASRQNEAFDRAFALWEHASSLDIERVNNRSDADITIEFKSPGDDDYDFDGRSGTLAYAYFPQVGITAFDDAEPWSYLGSIDLVTVAAHEFGHALGIDHSDDPGALLAPFYTGARPWLSDDDIAAIRDLYPPSGCHPSS